MSINNIPRMHKHLVIEILAILRSCFEEGYYIDKIIERKFKANKKWGSRDRRFVAESCFEMVRWWQKLWSALDKEPSFSDEALMELFAFWWEATDRELPDWDEFKRYRFNANLEKYDQMSGAQAASLPQWIYDKIASELPEAEREEAFEALNKKAEVVLRFNSIKTSRDSLREQLSAESIYTKYVDNYPHALVLGERTNVFRTAAFKTGAFEVQDGASQTVGFLLDVEPGMRVIDACAGAGGKSLHLASIMNNKGRIVSLDIHAHKLEELKKRARRAGVSIIDTRPIQTTKVVKRLAASADRVLLDVPCSGLGVLRRNPDTKWKINPDRIAELVTIQADIIQRYSKMTKPGGKMVYATCSVLREENEDQVEKFLNENEDWVLIKDERQWPHKNGFDGFYAALLQRN